MGWVESNSLFSVLSASEIPGETRIIIIITIVEGPLQLAYVFRLCLSFCFLVFLACLDCLCAGASVQLGNGDRNLLQKFYGIMTGKLLSE